MKLSVIVLISTVFVLLSCNNQEHSNITNKEVQEQVLDLIVQNKKRINEMENQRENEVHSNSSEPHRDQVEFRYEPSKEWVFFSADVRGKTIIASPYESERVYEYNTKCTKIYEISRSEYLELEEIMIDELPTLNPYSLNITGNRFDSYEEAYTNKKKITTGVLYTNLIDMKWDYR